MEQLVVIGQSTDTLPIKCTGLSLDLDSVGVSSSLWAMAGTATAKRANSELAKRSILWVLPLTSCRGTAATSVLFLRRQPTDWPPDRIAYTANETPKKL